MRIVIAFAFALIACTTSKPGVKPDAGSAAMRTCTGSAYDPCTDNSQCGSMNCHFYMKNSFTVCTVTCDATNPCPMDASGMPGLCNTMGLCKPSVANSCTP
jgi:hypothetical protein